MKTRRKHAIINGWTVPKNTAKVRKVTVQNTPTDNKFDALPNTDPTTPPRKTRIPPIIMAGGGTHGTTLALIKSAVKAPFTTRYTRENNVSVQCTTIEDFHAFQQRLKDPGINKQFHTFSLEAEKVTKSVVRGLPTGIPVEDIKEDLKAQGFEPTKVVAMATKEPRPTSPYLLFFPHGTDASGLKRIRCVLNVKITIDKYKKSGTSVTQCFRCQDYGHSQRNCNRLPRCVKCTLDHATSECPKKDRTTPAKCVGCGGEHPANFKGCPRRTEYQSKIQKRSHPQSTAVTPASGRNPFDSRSFFPALHQAAQAEPTHFPTLPRHTKSPTMSAEPTQRRSYSEAAKMNTAQQPQDLMSTNELRSLIGALSEMKSRLSACSSKMEKALVIVEYLDILYG
jgi:hypothetical protein